VDDGESNWTWGGSDGSTIICARSGTHLVACRCATGSPCNADKFPVIVSATCACLHAGDPLARPTMLAFLMCLKDYHESPIQLKSRAIGWSPAKPHQQEAPVGT